jgi:hypothetical protein
MEKEIDELNKEKISLEIEKLRSPWYKNLELWKIVIPTVAILLSLYFTFGKGMLDSQKERLELQKEQLKLEILTFENQKNEILKSITNSKDELSETNDKIVEHRLISDSLKKVVKTLRNEIELQKREQSQITGRLKRDKAFYIKELEKQYGLEKSYTTGLSILKDSLMKQQDATDLKKTELEFYKTKYKLTDTDQKELTKILLFKNMDLGDRRLKYLHAESARLKKKYDDIKFIKYDTLTVEELERMFEFMYLKDHPDH